MAGRIYDFLHKIGIENVTKLELPLRSRYPKRLARRLKFVQGTIGYWVLICRGLSCRACGFPQKPDIIIEYEWRRDILSDLRHKVPVLIVKCCGKVVTKGVWDGSRIVIDDFNCEIEVKTDGVYCKGEECRGEMAECIRECFGD